jgi:SAM-dependent methyltransferase
MIAVGPPAVEGARLRGGDHHDSMLDMTAPFDASNYWRERMRQPSLARTGNIGMPLSWQRWRYRSLTHGLLRVCRRHGVELAGSAVLDFGCGTGYFEDVWEQAGARQLSGIDVSADAIGALSARYPERTYRGGDLADTPTLLDGLAPQDLVTAIDVLYHVTEEERLRRIVARLTTLIAPGGHLLFTEGTRLQGTRLHMRHHSIDWWRDALWPRLELIAVEPVFVVHDRPVYRGARFLPGWAGSLIGATQYAADRVLLPWFPWGRKTIAILARRRS